MKFCFVTAVFIIGSFLAIISSEAQEISFWESRNVTLDEQAGRQNVVVGVWDTGIDIEVFDKRNIWINTNEKQSGSDSDGNGYVDDLHGIAFDLEENQTGALLMPTLDGLDQESMAQLAKESKGNRDFMFGIASEEAKQAIQSSLFKSVEENRKLADQLIWFGEYSHGTAMAQTCIRGNPFIRILTVRQQFSHSPPLPTVEGYQKRAKVYADVVKYMKDNSVRVANLSWSRWPELFEKALLKHKIGESDEDRQNIAKQLLDIERQALLTAMKNTPEILFVTSARNIGNGTYDKAIPQVFALPNTISVGAANKDGNRVLTAKNAIVDVFAHGHNVVSKCPGGLEVRTMGCSVACAQVTNLAAKLIAVNEKLSSNEVKKLIIETSIPSSRNSDVLLIHPKNALKAAKQLHKNRISR